MTNSPAFTAARTALIHDAYLARLARRFQHRPSPHRSRHLCATARSISPASLAIRASRSKQSVLQRAALGRTALVEGRGFSGFIKRRDDVSVEDRWSRKRRDGG